MTNDSRIILTGEVLPGHRAEEVVVALAKRLKTTEEKAAGLLAGRETVVKRNVPAAEVERYLRALSGAGAGVRHEPMPAASAPPAGVTPVGMSVPAAAPKPPPPPVSAAEPLSLVPPAPAIEMECPQCGHAQPKRTLCLKCGCDMPRVLAAQTQAKEAPVPAVESSVWTSPRARLEDMEEVEFTPPIFGLSLSGRIGRLRYLAYVWPLIAAIIVGFFLGIFMMTRHPVLGFAIMLPLMLAAFWMSIRYMALRLHDVNRSSKWILAVIVLSAAVGALQSPGLATVYSVLSWIGMLALMAWPGSPEHNDYGWPCGPNTFWVKVGAAIFIVLQVVGLIWLMKSGEPIIPGIAAARGSSGVKAPATAEPAYAEIRIERDVSGRQIEMAYFVRMDGESDCETQAVKIRDRMLRNCDSCVPKTLQCKAELAPRYALLFDNVASSTTYISLARGGPAEREGRLVFWGISVAEADMVCDSLVGQLQKGQTGRVQCIRARGG